MTERPNCRLLIVIAVGVWLNVVLQFVPELTRTGRRIEDLHSSDLVQGFALDRLRLDVGSMVREVQAVLASFDGIANGVCISGKIC